MVREYNKAQSLLLFRGPSLQYQDYTSFKDHVEKPYKWTNPMIAVDEKPCPPFEVEISIQNMAELLMHETQDRLKH